MEAVVVEAKYLNKSGKKWRELCPHVRTVLRAAESASVKIAGCGDCGSAWADCGTCGTTVINVQDAYRS